MSKRLTIISMVLVAIAILGPPSFAAVTVTLPNTAQTTTLTATVSEQCTVDVPAGVTFNVEDISSATVASGASVSMTAIALATATKQLKVSVQAGAAAFTPPVGGAVTWSASDVSWNAATWTNGTGASGTLSNASYTAVATADADAATTTTADLVFTLDPKGTVKRSGNHTLTISWKFESIGA